LDNLKKYGDIPGNIDDTLVTNILGVAIRDFILQYYNQHNNRYPNISVVPTCLKEYITKNKAIPNTFFKQYHLWSKIEFYKTLEYDYTPDTSELMKDSAAAPSLDSWGSIFDECAFRNLYGKVKPPSCGIPSKSPLRVIDGYLNDPVDSVEKLIDKIEQGKYIWYEKTNTQSKSIYDPRAFTTQTYPQRLIQTSMEHNIASIFFQVCARSIYD
jgi:hypothetical protein